MALLGHPDSWQHQSPKTWVPSEERSHTPLQTPRGGRSGEEAVGELAQEISGMESSTLTDSAVEILNDTLEIEECIYSIYTFHGVGS